MKSIQVGHRYLVPYANSLEFIPGQCCPVCQTSICRDNNGPIYQNGDVWTKNNLCTHCTCENGSIICSEEICPILQCKSNEKVVRLPNSCCAICSNRHICRFHDSCCVSCRQAKQCDLNGYILKEGSYRQIDNCTLCTCTSERQPECYSNCKHNGYAVIELQATSLHRNHTITVTDSLATIIAYSKSGTIIPSSQTRSVLFQFSSSTTTKSNAAVLLGIIHNSTGQISYRLIVIDFDSTINSTRINYSLSDELRLWMPLTVSTQHTIKSSISIIEDDQYSDEIILIILIIILSLICLILILIIMFLCYRRKQKTIEKEIYQDTFKRQASSLSIVEKFHAPDLTTKVTLLTHFHTHGQDLGTDV
ncbi:unnamed protein product [Rotaria sp. Silwood1]|nr:unnamed protein product [Rotaria sp. Silwood1]